jgi:hypothetical protein
MVSPYLLRPIRTLKQAQNDRARGRRRSKVAKSAARFAARFMVHTLPSVAVSTHVLPQSPTDREAA